LIDQRQLLDAQTAADLIIKQLSNTTHRRTLNTLSAKAYFYFARVYELLNKLDIIRPTLLALHRTAILKHNEEGQATLLNILLRSYILYNLYEQADKLVSNVTIREDTLSSNQLARYLYYQGLIKSVQLEYSEAFKLLSNASRKAPQNSAKGFRTNVFKCLSIVQLLMGEIPERNIFEQPGLRVALEPYYQLTQSVREGSLVSFNSTVKKNYELFKKDKTYTLIQRLRHNVIKTGLRKINTSYSRISFVDICSKLSLESVVDAQFIVAKAIRDGVINATINYEDGYISSHENLNLYSTDKPQQQFFRRIKFCFKTHNESVIALRFPADEHDNEQKKVSKDWAEELESALEEEDESEF